MTTRCPACGGTKKIMDYIEARANDCMVPLVPCPCVALAAANAARLVAEQRVKELEATLAEKEQARLDAVCKVNALEGMEAQRRRSDIANRLADGETADDE